jgi:drug/metabolite transporter (DMT)-like permease
VQAAVNSRNKVPISSNGWPLKGGLLLFCGEATITYLNRQPYLLLVATAILWAGNTIAGKFAVGHISPFLLTSSRWLVAFAILLPFAFPYLRRDLPVIRRHAAFLFLLGAIGFALFNNLFYLALNYTSAINVAIEQASMPLVVFVLNFLFFSIRTSRLQAGGFLLTLIGIVIIVTHGDPASLASQNVNVGDVLMMCAAFFYALYSVALVRKPRLHWLSFITSLAGAAFVASIPFTFWEFSAARIRFPDSTGFAVVAYTAVFPSIVAQLSWMRGLELIGSNRGGVFINLVPIFASALAIMLLGEAFLPYHFVALCLVLGGVWLSQQGSGAGARI